MNVAEFITTNWPDAVAIASIALSVAIGYTAWRFTGGKHSGERRHEQKARRVERETER